MAAATGLGFAVSYLTFQGMETAYQTAYPDISEWISYMATEGIRSCLFVIIVMTNILFILGGALIHSASEAAIVSSGIIGWVFPVLFCLAFFAGAGYTANSNFNTELRENVVATNNQIDQVSRLENTELTGREERLARRFTKLDVDLKGPRKILIASFDESFLQAQVLIDFDGTWVECLSLNGHVGNCERIEP